MIDSVQQAGADSLEHDLGREAREIRTENIAPGMQHPLGERNTRQTHQNSKRERSIHRFPPSPYVLWYCTLMQKDDFEEWPLRICSRSEEPTERKV